MAFGRDDVNRIYDTAIKKVLREMGVEPRRIDRIQHLDFINVKIIEEIRKCDFALADLTYARPSVYYEAGFAERAVPVIYICRRDHLSRKPIRDLQSCRVHFDLESKNIEPWTNTEDTDFSRRLKSKIDFVLRTIQAAVVPTSQEKKRAANFAARSPQARLDTLIQVSWACLGAAGYKQFKLESLTPPWAEVLKRKPPQWCFRFHRAYAEFGSTLGAFADGCFGRKTAGRRAKVVLVQVMPTITRRYVRNIRARWIETPIYELSSLFPRSSRVVDEKVFLVSLNKVDSKRISEGLNDFDYDGKYYNRFHLALPRRGSLPGHARIYATAHGKDFVLLEEPCNPRPLILDRSKTTRAKATLCRLCSRRELSESDWGTGLLPKGKTVERRVSVHIIEDFAHADAFADKFKTLLE